jgi:hypothetical protein
MATRSETPVFGAGDRVLDDLRSRLLTAGYLEERLPAVLGAAIDVALASWPANLHDRRLRDDGSLSTLVRFFASGVEVAEGQLARALGRRLVAALERAGVLRREGERVYSPFQILPYQGLLVFGDGRGSERRRNVVASVPSAARALAHLTWRRGAGSALDLGTGSGLQGLLAARHCRRVVATDVNPRAVAFARLNARLNELDNVEVRHGSWFDPVASERFDLIVSNPPYVISPDNTLLFRDSGLERDELCRLLVSGAPAFLNEGGLAQISCNWVLPREQEEDWSVAPATWASGNEQSALILRYSSVEAARYAANWSGSTAPKTSRSAALERWIDYFDREGIGAIADGAVSVRRDPRAKQWLLARDALGGPRREAGTQVGRIFAGQDYLQRVRDDEALLGEHLRPAEGIRLDQALRYTEGGGYLPEPTLLHFPSALPLETTLDPHVMRIVIACDGRRPLGETIERISSELGVEAGWLRALALPTLRDAIGLGFLTAVGGA